MSKHYRPWRGRPNAPPENWHTLDEPAIHKVGGDTDDDERDTSPFRKLRFSAADWIILLKALYLYRENHATPDWEDWYLEARRLILEKVDPESTSDLSIPIELTLNNWRYIWKAVKLVTADADESWQRWFARVSAEMTTQITKQDTK